MSKHKTWLWPDRTISKRESRELRDEHNALANSHAALLDALRECVTEPGANANSNPTPESYRRRLEAINDTARTAIAKATA